MNTKSHNTVSIINVKNKIDSVVAQSVSLMKIKHLKCKRLKTKNSPIFLKILQQNLLIHTVLL